MTIDRERWAEIERVAAFGTPPDTLPSKSALARMVEDLTDEVRRLREEADEEQPRAIIRHFAAAMERKLAANDGVKGGWRDESWVLLLDDLETEIAELRAALHGHAGVGRYAPADVQAVLLEAADVCNFAMMICDVVGALPPTDERGR